MFQDQVLKSSSLSNKQAEKCKFINAPRLHLSILRKMFQLVCSTPTRQLLDTSYLSRFKKEIKILISFLGICECVFVTPFLLILDI